MKYILGRIEMNELEKLTEALNELGNLASELYDISKEVREVITRIEAIEKRKNSK
jgi:hypothetical protein